MSFPCLLAVLSFSAGTGVRIHINAPSGYSPNIFNNGHWVATNERLDGMGNLRFKWEVDSWVPLKFEDFDKARFCANVPGSLLFVGDSISGQHFVVLAAQVGERKIADASWYPIDREPSLKDHGMSRLRAYEMCGGAQKIAYIRNYWIDARDHYTLYVQSRI